VLILSSSLLAGMPTGNVTGMAAEGEQLPKILMPYALPVSSLPVSSGLVLALNHIGYVSW